MGWDGIKDGQLIQRVNHDAFDVVITNDKRWKHQQNADAWSFGVIALSTNSWPRIQTSAEHGDLIRRLNDAIQSVAAGAIIDFEIGGDKA